MMAGYKNTLKQFKANYFNDDYLASNFEKSKCRMPPWMDEKPTNMTGSGEWDNHPWSFGALCKQGHGGWSPSQSTKGDPTPSKKARFTPGRSSSTKFCSMQARVASKGKLLQELLKCCTDAYARMNAHLL
jgi:hypothetical protein